MTADPFQIVASIADPAFATDEVGRIVIWNRAAEKLLGWSASEVLGRPCHEVTRGRDVFGNRFWYGQCGLHRMARDHEPICSFEVDLEKVNSDSVRVGVFIIAVPGPRPGQYSLIHLLRPAPSEVRRSADSRSGQSGVLPVLEQGGAPARDPATYSLTPREVEILRVLVEGWSTQEIADRLYISIATVRNHVQSILQKLDVHSRMEAVSLALRERLV